MVPLLLATIAPPVFAQDGFLQNAAAQNPAALGNSSSRSATHPLGSYAVVRDGVRDVLVRRTGPARVIVSPPNAPSFSAGIDRHALVRVAPGVDADALFTRLHVAHVRLVSASLRVYRVADDSGDGLTLAARLATHAGPSEPIVDAIPDYRLMHRTREIAIPPSDPRYEGQWFFERIGMEEAWTIHSGDPSTTIVVVDSGCDATHPDLAPQLDPGRDVLDDDDDPTPISGEPGNAHGTACAGLAAAATDNAEGVAGACPECRLRCVRLLRGQASEVPISADLAAFQFALDVDAAVVSNSWGFVEATPIPEMLRAAIEALVDEGRGGKGALVLFGAGNDNRELFDYEIEAVRGVLAIGAVNNFDEVAPFSNRGEPLDLVAPTGTLTTDIAGPDGDDPGDYTSLFGGTSSSCPVVAGVAGLLASAAPDKRGEELAAALIETAVPSPFATPDARGHDAQYGFGRVAPAAALRAVMPVATPDAGVDPEVDAGVDAGAGDASGGGCSVMLPSRHAPRAGLSLCVLALAGLAGRRRVR